MNKHFFSVVIPVYNVEKYLEECVNSILSQSYGYFEIILVDDGSKDKSPEICDRFSEIDNRVMVIHKTNGGLSDARNVGTARAKGNYIIYVDSDDYISDPFFLQKLNEKAATDVDIICYKFKKYFEDTREIVECTFSCPNIEKKNSIADKINEMVRMDAFYCSAWSKAIRLDIIKNNDIQFEKGLLGEDQEWYYHILLNARTITYIDEAVLVYRQRANSITSSWKMKNLTDCIYVVDKWYKQIQKSDLSDDYKKALLNSVAKLYCNLLIAYTRFSDSEKKKYYTKLRKMSGLLDYHINPRVNTFNKIYKLGGFNMLMVGLKIICKLR